MSSADRAPRLLVVDDDASMLMLAEATLVPAGFQVAVAANGELALAAAVNDMPDMVLLDVSMNGLDGFEVCRRVRRMPGGATLPIVLVTGKDDSDSIERAFEAGATDFITKPINWALIAHRVRYVLRNAENLQRLRASEARNRTLLQAIPDAILAVDQAGTIVQFVSHENAALGRPAELVLGRHWTELLPVDVAPDAGRALASVFADGTPVAFEFSRQPDLISEALRFECRCVPQGTDAALVIVRDVSERYRSAVRIHRLAFEDTLTGLPNRAALLDHLQRSLGELAASGGSVALLYLDLDQFKRINDTLGHAAGDRVLSVVSARLSEVVRAVLGRIAGVEWHLCRVGGDEFVLKIRAMGAESHAEDVARAIVEALQAPVRHLSMNLVVTPSLGIAHAGTGGNDVETLLKNADIAMYHAKASGRNRWCVYAPQMHESARRRLELEVDLRRALDEGQLVVYLQPKTRLCDLRVVGAEALVRWEHPERGLIEPASFIAVAEEVGLISEIDRYVLAEVVAMLGRWRDQGIEPVPVAVNLSSRNFEHPDLLVRLASLVAAAGIPVPLIEIEITESVLMHDIEDAARALLAMKDMGFRISVDDFGTGHSSLAYLKRLPIDSLKIDRSFVRDVANGGQDLAIVRSIIALAHNLGLEVVAEGVETTEQLELLQRESCDIGQGYLFCTPVPVPAFERILQHRSLDAAAAARLVATDCAAALC